MRMLYSTILASCVCCEVQHRIRSGGDAMQHARGIVFAPYSEGIIQEVTIILYDSLESIIRKLEQP